MMSHEYMTKPVQLYLFTKSFALLWFSIIMKLKQTKHKDSV